MASSSSTTQRHGNSAAADPVYVHARREALLILVVWALCLVWSVSYCVLTGYHREPGEIATILGVPSWIFWGIAVPWLVADAFTIWFSMFYMADDDLGEAHEGLDVAEQIEHEHHEHGSHDVARQEGDDAPHGTPPTDAGRDSDTMHGP